MKLHEPLTIILLILFGAAVLAVVVQDGSFKDVNQRTEDRRLPPGNR